MNSFGEYMRTIRKSRGMLQRKLATEIGVDFSYICKIENNLNSPSDDVLIRIADVLQVDIEEMMRHAERLTPDLRKMIFNNPDVFKIIRDIEKNNLTYTQFQSMIKENVG